MRKIRRLGLSLVLAVLVQVGLTVPALAAGNPTVSITVVAEVVSITNSQASWPIGIAIVDATKYFASDVDVEDKDYSTVTNTGSVAVDIAIQGTDIEGGSYDWAISATGVAASETYGLNATAGNGTGAYSTIVKKTPFNNLATALAAEATWGWSMLFKAPTAFNANDDGAQKTSTLTLVASKT